MSRRTKTSPDTTNDGQAPKLEEKKDDIRDEQHDTTRMNKNKNGSCSIRACRRNKDPTDPNNDNTNRKDSSDRKQQKQSSFRSIVGGRGLIRWTLVLLFLSSLVFLALLMMMTTNQQGNIHHGSSNDNPWRLLSMPLNSLSQTTSYSQKQEQQKAFQTPQDDYSSQSLANPQLFMEPFLASQTKNVDTSSTKTKTYTVTTPSPPPPPEQLQQQQQQQQEPQCSIYMAPSSLKGVDGFGIYTTRPIGEQEALLQSNLPDAPSIPVVDYSYRQFAGQVDPIILAAHRQFVGLFNHYWWGRGKPDHVGFLSESPQTVDFQITFGSLPNHHCVLDALDAPYPQTPQYPPYDDSWRVAPSVNQDGSIVLTAQAGAISYSNGRNFTALRDLEANEEIFLDYGLCKPHDQDEDNGDEWESQIPNQGDLKEAAELVQTNFWPWALAQVRRHDDDNNNNFDGNTQLPQVETSHRIIQTLLPKTVADLELVMGVQLTATVNDNDSRQHQKDMIPSPQTTQQEEIMEIPVLMRRLARLMGTTTRTTEWIRENGLCLEHLIAKPSTIPNAGRGAFTQHAIAQGDVIVPAPILHILDRRALTVLSPQEEDDDDDDDEEDDSSVHKQQQQQLLLNYCIGHPESTVLMCPNTNAILINHSPTPNAKFRFSQSFDAKKSDQWRRYTLDELWEHSQGGQRGLFMEVVALRDIAIGEEIKVDYGPDWERAWKQYVEEQYNQSEEKLLGMHSSIAVANQEDVIELQSGNLRESTWDHNEYMFTGCQYHVNDEFDDDFVYHRPDPNWRELDDETLLRRYADDASQLWPYKKYLAMDEEREDDEDGRKTTPMASPASVYATHYDESYWPCTVISQSEQSSSSSSADTYYTVRIHQHPRYDTTPWAENDLPRLITNFPRNAIHYFVKPNASDQQRPNVFRHFIGLPERRRGDDGDDDDRSVFPEQWKNLRSENPNEEK